MEINFNDSLLDDDPITPEEEEIVEETPVVEDPIDESAEPEDPVDEPDLNNEEEKTVDYSDNAIYSFLQDYGIADPSKMQFEDENGEIIERNFNDLTFDEQKEVLKQITDPGLSEYEYSVVNYLRQNRVTLDDVINHASQEAVKAYLAEHPEDVHQKQYSIDEYTDDELYIADLKTKFQNFTDDELLSKLESAKANEDLFKKEVDELRTQYKALEDQERETAAARERQEYEDLRGNLTKAVSNFNGIFLDYTDPQSDSLVIEDQEKRDMLAYMLDQDKTGKSQLAKDLEDPDALAEIA